MKTITLCLAILGLAGSISAQNDLNLPDVSQAAEVKQRVALTDIAVKYHRPLVNGRKIWGGLVPYGKVWRVGANEKDRKSTRLNSSHSQISYAVFCLKKKKNTITTSPRHLHHPHTPLPPTQPSMHAYESPQIQVGSTILFLF